MFTTDDPDIIAALQAHPKYAGDYQLIEGGKEFTGTDEGPMVTWGNASIEYPQVTPQEGNKLYKFIVPEDGSSSDDSVIKDGDIYWDGVRFNYKKNGVKEYFISNVELDSRGYFAFTKSLPYTESNGIGSAQSIPYENFLNILPRSGSYSSCWLHAVIIENMGGSIVSNITVFLTNSLLSELSVESGKTKIFQIPAQELNPILNGGGGNSMLAVTRPVSAIPLKYTFIFAFL